MVEKPVRTTTVQQGGATTPPQQSGDNTSQTVPQAEQGDGIRKPIFKDWAAI